MRAFLPERDNERENTLIKQLRTNRPLLPYARRSDPVAKNEKKDKSQSREMQTEDMIKWGKAKGWTDNLIYPYFADLGLSGTLRPDQRPDMLRLFEDLDSGKFDGATIACWQENRLFRDETHIYYNQLIDKMLLHNVVLVVLSPRLYIYDMRDEYDKERLREKLKEAAEFIPKHIKGWLHPARERAAWEDDEWAGMGDLPPGFIVDYDPDSPTYKHAIPYWPHLEKVEEYFELFMEMAGEQSLFFQHLKVSPIVFPEFDSTLDRRIINKCKMTPYPGGGYYIKGKVSILSLLTHPMYGGYRAVKNVIRRDEQGNKLQSHEPVIGKELREFAYNHLAKTDFDGKPIERQGHRRFLQERTFTKNREFGLLKFRVRSDQGEVHTHALGPGGSYCILNKEDSFIYGYIVDSALSCSAVDDIVVKRLLEHAETMSKQEQNVEDLKASVAKIRSARLAKISQIKKSINDIDKEQSGLTRSLGKVEREIEELEAEGDDANKLLKERRKDLIEQEIETLEIERIDLIETKEALEEEDEEDIGSLEEELIKLKNDWHDRSFKKRRSLLNFAIQEVRINRVSSHWAEIQVLWLHEEWGRERLYYRRKIGTMREWSESEISILAQHYETTPMPKLMALLPERTIYSMRGYARDHLGLSRLRRDYRLNASLSETHLDIEFERKQDIPKNARLTNWERLY